MTEVLEAQIGDQIRRWKPYPAYKDSGVEWLGEIPEHWETRRLKDVSDRSALYGANESSEAYLPQGARFIRTSDISDHGVLLDESPVYVDESTVQDYRLASGDLLLSRSGTIGRSFVFDAKEHGPCAYAGYLVRFQLGRQVLPRFVFHFTKTSAFHEWLSTTVVESTIGNLSGQKYASMPLPVPPIQEQAAIERCLDRETAKIDALIAKKQALTWLLREQRRAEINRFVIGGEATVAEDKDGWQARLPGRWRALPIKRVASFITSGSRGWADYYSPEGAIFLRIGNLSRETTKLRLDVIQRVDAPPGAEADRTRVQPGDVLLSITAYIGSVGVVPDDIGAAYVNQHLSLIRLRQDHCDPQWMANCLVSEIGRQQLDLSLYGGTKDGLGLDDVGSVVVPLPPLHEQKRCVAKIDRMNARTDKLIKRIQEGIEKLQDYREALISAAVTGKIDVRGAA